MSCNIIHITSVPPIEHATERIRVWRFGVNLGVEGLLAAYAGRRWAPVAYWLPHAVFEAGHENTLRCIVLQPLVELIDHFAIVLQHGFTC